MNGNAKANTLQLYFTSRLALSEKKGKNPVEESRGNAKKCGKIHIFGRSVG